jgi:hypothetical protein
MRVNTKVEGLCTYSLLHAQQDALTHNKDTKVDAN